MGHCEVLAQSARAVLERISGAQHRSLPREVHYDSHTSNEVHSVGSVCVHCHVWCLSPCPKTPGLQTNATAQSLSTGGELADASPEHEWRPVGRVNSS